MSNMEDWHTHSDVQPPKFRYVLFDESISMPPVGTNELEVAQAAADNYLQVIDCVDGIMLKPQHCETCTNHVLEEFKMEDVPIGRYKRQQENFEAINNDINNIIAKAAGGHNE